MAKQRIKNCFMKLDTTPHPLSSRNILADFKWYYLAVILSGELHPITSLSLPFTILNSLKAP